MTTVTADHAILSPSQSNRWLNCTGSIAAALVQPESKRNAENPYSILGTAAHELLEISLALQVDPTYFKGIRLNEKRIKVDSELINPVNHAIAYVNDYVRANPGTKLYIEKRIDISRALDIYDPPTFGTADIVMDSYQLSHSVDEVVIVDYKNGSGVVVEVEENTQLLMYAMGYRAETRKTPKQFRLVLVQPNVWHREGPIREWILDNKELNKFQTYIKGRAKLAIDKSNPIFTPGTWCTFCPVRGSCKAFAEYNLDNVKAMFSAATKVNPSNLKDPITLTPEKVGEYLHIIPLLQVWIRALQQQASAMLSSGIQVPGWKHVAGRAGVRKWREKNTKKIIQWIISTIEDKGHVPIHQDDIAPRIPVSPAQLEKKAKKLGIDQKIVDMLLAETTRTPPKLHLTTTNDPRKAANIAKLLFSPVKKDDA